MNIDLPLISIIIPTFNRAHTIERAINSILNQTYKNIEIIIIDDGSNDNTLEILNIEKYSQIRLYQHEKNRGVTAAKNTGLDQINGEWFTILDSDDEIVPVAIETMMKIPLSIDTSITAVTCNCLDTSTNEFSGMGLNEDQYIDVKTLMTVCEGEFWGITKTSLLQKDRFNEKIKGSESILWFKIDDRAKRYYVHLPLRIYHTEGSERIMKAKYNFNQEVTLYENLIYEDYYLNKIKTYYPQEYFSICRNGLIVMRASNRKKIALKYYELSKMVTKSIILDLSYQFKLFSIFLKRYKIFKSYIKSYSHSFKSRKKR